MQARLAPYGSQPTELAPSMDHHRLLPDFVPDTMQASLHAWKYVCLKPMPGLLVYFVGQTSMKWISSGIAIELLPLQETEPPLFFSNGPAPQWKVV